MKAVPYESHLHRIARMTVNNLWMSWRFLRTTGYFSCKRLRPAPVPIGGRSFRPPAEREALNLVLDVLAQLLEDAFDVLGRAVIGKCP